MKTLKRIKLVLPLLLIPLLFGCNDSQSSDPNAIAPTISIRLVDAPGDYEAVNIEIVDVMIKMNNDNDDDNGWLSLEANNETVNLLDFTGGFSKVLVERFPIPTGTLSQMRLVLGDGNTIVIKNDSNENEEFNLKTPSAQQSGLKLKVNTLIEEGYTYDFILDFDVEKSIVRAGNSSNIILKPVLYVNAEASSGIIQGTVSPTDVPSMASVLVDDVMISAFTNDNGTFALWGVPAGIYEVVVTPLDDTSEYTSGSAAAITVSNGEITMIPTPIELQLKPGSISGDVTNNFVVSVTLKLKNTSDVITTVNSNENGEFLIENVPAGTYTVTVSKADYVSQDIEAIVIPNAITPLADITLVVQ
jgi:hypothetical protein